MDLVAARFLDRPNRFVVIAALEDGRPVRAHLADPGRLRELLLPGAELRLRRAASGSGRATEYTVTLVRSPLPPAVWVSLDTMLPNRLAETLLADGAVRGVGRGWGSRREVVRGRSRFDFLLSEPGATEMLVEVKSVTLVENRIARFPDAPTTRGTRHVGELAEVARSGGRAMVLFVVQREDADAVTSNAGTDPEFARVLRLAQDSGVLLRAARFRLGPDGEAEYAGALPVRARS